LGILDEPTHVLLPGPVVIATLVGAFW